MEANEEFAKSMDMTIEELQFAIQRLQEVWSLQQHNLNEINLDNYSFIVLFFVCKVNPMLGLRGCRLGIVIPELVEMQARALGMYI